MTVGLDTEIEVSVGSVLAATVTLVVGLGSIAWLIAGFVFRGSEG